MEYINAEVVPPYISDLTAYKPGKTIAQAGARAIYKDTAFLKRSREMVKRGKKWLYTLLDEYDVKYVPSIA